MPTPEQKKEQLNKILDCAEQYLLTIVKATKTGYEPDLEKRRRSLLDAIEEAGKL